MKRLLRIALLSLMALAVLAGVVVYIGYRNLEKKRELALREMLLNVPKDTPKECLKDRQMMMTGGGIVDLGTDKPKKGCPGYVEGQNPDYGSYTLGPYAFRVPREYIWLSRYKLDGEVSDGLYLMFHYPDMTPGDADARDQDKNVEADLRYLGDCSYWVDKSCGSHAISLYHVKLGLSMDAVKVEFSKAVDDDALNVKKAERYFLRDSGEKVDHKEVYYRGDGIKPDYWLICDVKENERQRPRCYSAYDITKGTRADYSFNKDLLPYHDDIRTKLTEKLTSFMITPAPEEKSNGTHRQ